MQQQHFPRIEQIRSLNPDVAANYYDQMQQYPVQSGSGSYPAFDQQRMPPFAPMYFYPQSMSDYHPVISAEQLLTNSYNAFPSPAAPQLSSLHANIYNRQQMPHQQQPLQFNLSSSATTMQQPQIITSSAAFESTSSNGSLISPTYQDIRNSLLVSPSPAVVSSTTVQVDRSDSASIDKKVDVELLITQRFVNCIAEVNKLPQEDQQKSKDVLIEWYHKKMNSTIKQLQEPVSNDMISDKVFKNSSPIKADTFRNGREIILNSAKSNIEAGKPETISENASVAVSATPLSNSQKRSDISSPSFASTPTAISPALPSKLMICIVCDVQLTFAKDATDIREMLREHFCQCFLESYRAFSCVDNKCKETFFTKQQFSRHFQQHHSAPASADQTVAAQVNAVPLKEAILSTVIEHCLLFNDGKMTLNELAERLMKMENAIEELQHEEPANRASAFPSKENGRVIAKNRFANFSGNRGKRGRGRGGSAANCGGRRLNHFASKIQNGGSSGNIGIKTKLRNYKANLANADQKPNHGNSSCSEGIVEPRRQKNLREAYNLLSENNKRRIEEEFCKQRKKSSSVDFESSAYSTTSDADEISSPLNISRTESSPQKRGLCKSAGVSMDEVCSASKAQKNQSPTNKSPGNVSSSDVDDVRLSKLQKRQKFIEAEFARYDCSSSSTYLNIERPIKKEIVSGSYGGKSSGSQQNQDEVIDLVSDADDEDEELVITAECGPPAQAKQLCRRSGGRPANSTRLPQNIGHVKPKEVISRYLGDSTTRCVTVNRFEVDDLVPFVVDDFNCSFSSCKTVCNNEFELEQHVFKAHVDIDHLYVCKYCHGNSRKDMETNKNLKVFTDKCRLTVADHAFKMHAERVSNDCVEVRVFHLEKERKKHARKIIDGLSSMLKMANKTP